MDRLKGRQSGSKGKGAAAKGIHGRGAGARQARRGAFEAELEDIEKRLSELVGRLIAHLVVMSVFLTSLRMRRTQKATLAIPLASPNFRIFRSRRSRSLGCSHPTSPLSRRSRPSHCHMRSRIMTSSVRQELEVAKRSHSWFRCWRSCIEPNGDPTMVWVHS